MTSRFIAAATIVAVFVAPRTGWPSVIVVQPASWDRVDAPAEISPALEYRANHILNARLPMHMISGCGQVDLDGGRSIFLSVWEAGLDRMTIDNVRSRSTFAGGVNHLRPDGHLGSGLDINVGGPSPLGYFPLSRESNTRRRTSPSDAPGMATVRPLAARLLLASAASIASVTMETQLLGFRGLAGRRFPRARRRGARWPNMSTGRPNSSGGTLFDLGTLGGTKSRAISINAQSTVIGEADTSSGTSHAFRWTPEKGAMQDLGTLGGRSSSARGINSNGEIVGHAETEQGAIHAFRWDPKTQRMSDLGTLGGAESRALGINDVGTIVGISQTAHGRTKAFVWDASTKEMRALKSVGGDMSHAATISDDLLVVGYATNEENETCAVVWDLNSGSVRQMGLPNMTATYGLGINANNQVVGYGQDDQGTSRAFVWDLTTDTIQTVGEESAGTRAQGINGRGQVTGVIDRSGRSSRAFFWSASKLETTVLDTLGGRTGRGWDINTQGRVVGSSLNRCCQEHAFLWIPDDEAGEEMTSLPADSEVIADPGLDVGFVTGLSSYLGSGAGAGSFGSIGSGSSGLGQTPFGSVGAGGGAFGGSGGGGGGGSGGGSTGSGGFGSGGGTAGGGTAGGGTVLGHAPEPASVVVWLVLLLGGLGWEYRRRRTRIYAE